MKKIFMVLLLISPALFLNQNDLTVALSIFKKLKISNFVLLSETAFDANTIASQIKLISAENIISNVWNIDQFANHIYKQVQSYHKTGIISKKLNPIKEFFVSQPDLIYGMGHYTWVVFDEDIQLSIPYDCQFISVRKIDEKTYKLTEIYTVRNKRFVKDFGKWDSTFGLDVENTSFYWRRLNLNRSVVQSLTYDMVHPDTCLKKEKRSLVCKAYEIFDDFKKIMNFRNNITVAPFEKYDEAVIGKDAVIFPGIWNIITEDFTKKIGPIYLFTENLYIKYPRGELQSDYYLLPFDKNVWLVILSFLTLGTIQIVFQILAIKEKKFEIGKIFVAFEIFCNQSNEESDNLSLKITLLTLNIIAFVIVNSFGAVISAFLSVEIPEIPFTDLEGFVKNGHYNLLLVKGGNTEGTLMRSDNILHQAILKNHSILHDEPYGSDIFERYNKVCLVEKLVVVGVEVDMHDLNLPCRIFKLSEPLVKTWVALQLTAICPFAESFNINWLRLGEYGYGIDRRMKTFPVRLEIAEESFETVEIEQLAQVLMIPVIGMALAIVILIGELTYKKEKERKSK